ncbi:MAG: RNA polymerase sigma factor [Chitinophagia bacterium]|nr:RNA polymerase sigma factor [Chitinophagia bacterium]
MALKAKKSKVIKSLTPAAWSVAQFSSFYTQNRTELIAHANRIIKDRAKAEEITQEALVKFMLAAPELESDDHALSYLHRTIENLCIDLFRAENRRPNLVAIDDALIEVESTWQVSGDHSQAISAAEDAAIIRQALSLLSPAERAALVMWEVEGRSTTEIAKELGIKESAVRHTVSRARASLRRVLSELVIDEARGLTALDLLSTTYKKAAELAGKSSKIALTFILVLTAFLGLNSLTGNEPNTSITTSSSQLSNNQDLPAVAAPVAPEVTISIPEVSNEENSITPSEYADHMQLSLNQLETVTLMLQVLEQADSGPTATE